MNPKIEPPEDPRRRESGFSRLPPTQRLNRPAENDTSTTSALLRGRGRVVIRSEVFGGGRTFTISHAMHLPKSLQTRDNGSGPSAAHFQPSQQT